MQTTVQLPSQPASIEYTYLGAKPPLQDPSRCRMNMEQSTYWEILTPIFLSAADLLGGIYKDQRERAVGAICSGLQEQTNWISGLALTIIHHLFYDIDANETVHLDPTEVYTFELLRRISSTPMTLRAEALKKALITLDFKNIKEEKHTTELPFFIDLCLKNLAFFKGDNLDNFERAVKQAIVERGIYSSELIFEGNSYTSFRNYLANSKSGKAWIIKTFKVIRKGENQDIFVQQDNPLYFIIQKLPGFERPFRYFPLTSIKTKAEINLNAEEVVARVFEGGNRPIEKIEECTKDPVDKTAYSWGETPPESGKWTWADFLFAPINLLLNLITPELRSFRENPNKEELAIFEKELKNTQTFFPESPELLRALYRDRKDKSILNFINGEYTEGDTFHCNAGLPPLIAERGFLDKILRDRIGHKKMCALMQMATIVLHASKKEIIDLFYSYAEKIDPWFVTQGNILFHVLAHYNGADRATIFEKTSFVSTVVRLHEFLEDLLSFTKDCAEGNAFKYSTIGRYWKELPVAKFYLSVTDEKGNLNLPQHEKDLLSLITDENLQEIRFADSSLLDHDMEITKFDTSDLKTLYDEIFNDKRGISRIRLFDKDIEQMQVGNIIIDHRSPNHVSFCAIDGLYVHQVDYKYLLDFLTKTPKYQVGTHDIKRVEFYRQTLNDHNIVISLFEEFENVRFYQV